MSLTPMMLILALNAGAAPTVADLQAVVTRLVSTAPSGTGLTAPTVELRQDDNEVARALPSLGVISVGGKRLNDVEGPEVWAFVIGHELGHMLDVRESAPFGEPEAIEGRADALGFELACRAGWQPPSAQALSHLLQHAPQWRLEVALAIRALLYEAEPQRRVEGLRQRIEGLAWLPPESRVIQTVFPTSGVSACANVGRTASPPP